MSKSELNYKNENDYGYTANLTDAGWAWEFIRRSDSYRAAYQSLKSEDFKRVVPDGTPQHFLTAAEKAEAMDAKYPVPPRTPAQKKAALWGLCEMYDPNIIYDHKKIRCAKPFWRTPVIYGSKGANVRPIDEIYCVDDLPAGPTTVAVFLDLNKNLAGQLKQVKVVLKANSKEKRRRINEWPRYLRILDAREDEIMSHAQKMRLIDSKKQWKQKKSKDVMDDADSAEWAVYANDTLQEAERMTEEGFRFLLQAI